MKEGDTQWEDGKNRKLAVRARRWVLGVRGPLPVAAALAARALPPVLHAHCPLCPHSAVTRPRCHAVTLSHRHT
jgi:hypothetical protein